MTRPDDIDETARETSIARADDLIRFLNELVETDRDAIHRLIETRVPCNTEMGDHPTVQVRATESGQSVGLLGILNGFVGTDTDGWGFICAEYDDSERLTRFKRTPPRSSCES